MKKVEGEVIRNIILILEKNKRMIMYWKDIVYILDNIMKMY